MVMVRLIERDIICSCENAFGIIVEMTHWDNVPLFS